MFGMTFDESKQRAIVAIQILEDSVLQVLIDHNPAERSFSRDIAEKLDIDPEITKVILHKLKSKELAVLMGEDTWGVSSDIKRRIL